VTHFANADYWALYHRLPADVRETADRCFTLLKSDPKHPSLHFKKIGDLWSVRVGLHYRALGVDADGSQDGVLWFWIGPHAEYDHIIKHK
jgi:hypothetical protein